MRNRYLVAYDISHEKRLRKTFETLKGYGEWLQYSLFSCDLTRTERVRMIRDVREEINEREDRVLIVDIGPARTRGSECVEVLGKQLPPAGRGAIVL